MTEDNPYLVMESKVFKEHVTQITEALEKQGMTTLQAFGESLTEDTINKVTEHASLTSEVKTLQDAAATAAVADKISPDTLKLAKLSTDRVVSEIKAIDEHFPIDKIMNSSLNEFEKIDMLSAAKQGAEYSQKAINAIKEQVGSSGKPGTQGYSAPDETTDADVLTEKLIEASGMKVD